MEYNFMEPPFEIKPFNEMTKKEAQKHFDWYISEIPKRIDLLRNAYEFTGGGAKESLNKTPDSLKPLWEWFLPYVTTVEKTKEEIEAEVYAAPKWLSDTILSNNLKLSNETLVIAMDIAIYFAEVLIKKHNQLKWGFITKPKSLVYLNRPVVEGFINNKNLDPRNVIKNLTSKVSKSEKDPNALYDMFKIWEEYIG